MLNNNRKVRLRISKRGELTNLYIYNVKYGNGTVFIDDKSFKFHDTHFNYLYDNMLQDDIIISADLITLNISNQDVFITDIDLRELPNLSIINLSGHLFKTLNLTNQRKLTKLSLNETLPARLDLSNNPLLNTLFLERAKLESLDVSKNVLLEILSITGLPISKIDLSENVLLKTFAAAHTKITDIDFSCNFELKTVNIGYNEIADLDFSKNTKLGYLNNDHSIISSLNLEKNLELYHLSLYRNLNLTNLILPNNQNLKVLMTSCCDLLENVDIENQLELNSIFLYNADTEQNCHLQDVKLPSNMLTNTDFNYLALSYRGDKVIELPNLINRTITGAKYGVNKAFFTFVCGAKNWELNTHNIEFGDNGIIKSNSNTYNPVVEYYKYLASVVEEEQLFDYPQHQVFCHPTELGRYTHSLSLNDIKDLYYCLITLLYKSEQYNVWQNHDHSIGTVYSINNNISDYSRVCSSFSTTTNIILENWAVIAERKTIVITCQDTAEFFILPCYNGYPRFDSQKSRFRKFSTNEACQGNCEFEKVLNADNTVTYTIHIGVENQSKYYKTYFCLVENKYSQESNPYASKVIEARDITK